MEPLFLLANIVILPIWAALIFAPRARLTAWLIASPWVIVPPCLLYGAVVLPRFAELLPVVARPELAVVQAALGSQPGTVAAWTHFVAFDLFVGRYIALDARERDLPSPLLSVVLLLTLLFGPLGLVGYLSLRSGAWPRMRRVFEWVKESSPALLAVSIVSALVAVASVALSQFDLRQLHGASVWLKPAKFGSSIAIACITLALVLRAVQIPAHRRKLLLGVIASGFGVDLAIVTLQAARGVESHFNAATWYDRTLYIALGTAIALVMLAFVELSARAFRTQYRDRALGWGIRAGLVLMVLGSNTAWFMTRPTPEQLEHLKAGEAPSVVGSHSVGASGEGGSVPLTRWNTDAGDLRVPHFVGTHSLQILPLVGLWLGRRRWRDERRAVQLTLAAAFVYFGVMVTTLVQALRGLPFWQFDTVTSGVGLTFVAATAFAVLFGVQRASGGASSREFSHAPSCAAATAHR